MEAKCGGRRNVLEDPVQENLRGRSSLRVPDIVYFDIKEKVGFRINNSSLCVGCKYKAKIWYHQMLSTKIKALTVVDKTINKKSVLSIVKWRIFCTFATVLPVSLILDKLDSV